MFFSQLKSDRMTDCTFIVLCSTHRLHTQIENIEFDFIVFRSSVGFFVWKTCTFKINKIK